MLSLLLDCYTSRDLSSRVKMAELETQFAYEFSTPSGKKCSVNLGVGTFESESEV
jgi:hypothetical protein